jgi:signal peptidase I
MDDNSHDWFSAPPEQPPAPELRGDVLDSSAGQSAVSAEPDPALERRWRRTARVVDGVKTWVQTLASAAVYATLLMTFGFQVARVEGHSMAPTLADHDRLIVNKAAYVPWIGEPQVGDIVMLYYPNKPEKAFVKRVIAAEGDTLQIVAGKVYRNNSLMDDSFVPAQFRSHEDWGPEVVPEGCYFVMGDNRNNSWDSRHWRFVPKRYITGRVRLRWWPVPDSRIF